MKGLPSKTTMRNNRPRKGRIVYAALFMVGLFLIAAASSNLYATQQEDYSARSEYDQLRELFHAASGASGSAANQFSTDPTNTEQAEPLGMAPRQPDQDIPGQARPDQLAGLIGLNPDFIGWVAIDDTGVDYPVALGRDNDYYLHVTFTGNPNPAGAIFMDYRNANGFDEPVCILYGHNMRDGSMFAPLNRYTDPVFMEDHPLITVTTAQGETLVYRVLDAVRTDMRDSVYDFADIDGATAIMQSGGATDGVERLLLLSTCTPGADRDERLLVYAVYKEWS